MYISFTLWIVLPVHLDSMGKGNAYQLTGLVLCRYTKRAISFFARKRDAKLFRI